MYVKQLHTASPRTGEKHRTDTVGSQEPVCPDRCSAFLLAELAGQAVPWESQAHRGKCPRPLGRDLGSSLVFPALLATPTPNLGHPRAWPWGLTLTEDPAAPHPGRGLLHPFQKPGCRVRGGACLPASSATSIQTWHRPGPAPGVGQPAAGSDHGEGLSLEPREKRGFWGLCKAPHPGQASQDLALATGFPRPGDTLQPKQQ